MIIVDDMAQGSKEWVELRLGVATASGCNKLFSFGTKRGWRHEGCSIWHKTEESTMKCRKGGAVYVDTEELSVSLSSQRTAYRNQLLAEWATGAPSEKWMGNEATERGNLMEGEACDFFRMHTGMEVRHCAFIFRDEARTAGASPDGLIYDAGGNLAGGLELKCPYSDTHVGYLLDGRNAYEEQVQMSLWASQLPAWWFMSYHHDLPPYLEKITPQVEYQAAFEEHMPGFMEELAEGRDMLRRIGVNK